MIIEPLDQRCGKWRCFPTTLGFQADKRQHWCDVLSCSRVLHGEKKNLHQVSKNYFRIWICSSQYIYIYKNFPTVGGKVTRCSSNCQFITISVTYMHSNRSFKFKSNSNVLQCWVLARFARFCVTGNLWLMPNSQICP